MNLCLLFNTMVSVFMIWNHLVLIKKPRLFLNNPNTKTKNPILMHLALQVRNRRYMLSLTQEQLAEKINCHVNYLGGIERAERNLSLILLIALAKGLECTLKDLLPQY